MMMMFMMGCLHCRVFGRFLSSDRLPWSTVM